MGASNVVRHTSKKLGLQAHGVKGIGDLVVIALNLRWSDYVSLTVMTLQITNKAQLKCRHTFWDLLKTLVCGSHDCDLFHGRSQPSGL